MNKEVSFVGTLVATEVEWWEQECENCEGQARFALWGWRELLYFAFCFSTHQIPVAKYLVDHFVTIMMRYTRIAAPCKEMISQIQSGKLISQDFPAVRWETWDTSLQLNTILYGNGKRASCQEMAIISMYPERTRERNIFAPVISLSRATWLSSWHGERSHVYFPRVTRRWR
ncbi:hypothetical protein OPV22_024699 [Ensete ventricosum]|uniref:Uncharacterized protein n=1 Tax=Ensete ventricosum TaxID=4639 RepID=A0AAV8P6N1_ENSVE|nr:hypothetical protein OPV22_024699 [Ensete ventricosum]